MILEQFVAFLGCCIQSDSDDEDVGYDDSDVLMEIKVESTNWFDPTFLNPSDPYMDCFYEESENEDDLEIIPEELNKEESLLKLVKSQSADGSWSSLRFKDKLLQKQFGDRIASTATAVAVLTSMESSQKEEFKSAVKKALRFLDRNASDEDWSSLIECFKGQLQKTNCSQKSKSV